LYLYLYLGTFFPKYLYLYLGTENKVTYTTLHLKNKNLLSIHASRVFNCDETNIQFVPKSNKVLTETGARNSYKIFDGCEKESLTALFMYSADGTRAPPMIMFKYKEVVPSNI
jgi:hypothetical protein